MACLLVDLQVAHTILSGTVVVGVERESSLLGGGDHHLSDVSAAAVIVDIQRPADSTVLISAAGEVLQLLEVGQDLVVGPAHSTVLGPTVEIGSVATHIQHGVHRRRTADHLAAGHVKPSPHQAWFGVRVVAPVPIGLEQFGECGRDSDFEVAVRAAGFE